MTRLIGLQFKIVYRKGKENVAADALSRVTTMMNTQSYSEVRPIWIQKVINSYARDTYAQDLLTQLEVSSPNEQGYSLHQGIIRHGSQIWVGENFALKTKLINAFHNYAVGGHSGVQATYLIIKKIFHYKGLKGYMQNFVTQCSTCQLSKHERVHSTGLLQPLHIPASAWQDISLDFIEGLPNSEGLNSILVIMD
jgi:hypothetical protein